VMGKGFDKKEIDAVQGRVLLAGHCAIEELGDMLIQRLGKRRVYRSGACNNLRDTTESMCHLMKVSPMKLAPMNPIKSLYAIMRAYLNNTHGRLVNPASNLFKLR
jgi:hypothetical protein